MSNDLRGIRKEIVMTHLKLLNWSFDRRAYLLTYFLTPWSRVLLEKLTGLQLVKKFLTFYGT
jgi:hypothetical protein